MNFDFMETMQFMNGLSTGVALCATICLFALFLQRRRNKKKKRQALKTGENFNLATERLAIWHEVLMERDRQMKKWGLQTHPPGTWFMILIEEIGEAAKDFLHRDLVGAREELIQALTVNLQWLEVIAYMGDAANHEYHDGKDWDKI